MAALARRDPTPPAGARPSRRSCLVRLLLALVSAGTFLSALVIMWGSMWCCSFDPQRYPKEYARRRREADNWGAVGMIALATSVVTGVAAVWPRKRIRG